MTPCGLRTSRNRGVYEPNVPETITGRGIGNVRFFRSCNIRLSLSNRIKYLEMKIIPVITNGNTMKL